MCANVGTQQWRRGQWTHRRRQPNTCSSDLQQFSLVGARAHSAISSVFEQAAQAIAGAMRLESQQRRRANMAEREGETSTSVPAAALSSNVPVGKLIQYSQGTDWQSS